MDTQELRYQHAMSYVEQGLPVYPTKGKRPINGISFKNATLSPSVVKAWFLDSKVGDEQNWGIGVAIPDWIVIVDVENKDGVNGLDTLRGLDFCLPSTTTSGAVGKHFWYRIPQLEGSNTTALRKNRIKILKGVDILRNGGVIVPPSPHPSGCTYRWDTGPFNVTQLAEAPDWIEHLVEQSEKEHPPVDTEACLRGIQAGRRHIELFRMACYYRHFDYPIHETKTLLREAARNSEYKDRDPDTIVDAVYRRYGADVQKQEEEKKGMKYIRVKDLVRKYEGARVPMLVDGLVPCGGLTMVMADPKKGKSAFVNQMATAVARGTPFLDRFAVEQAGVLYLDLEQGEIPAAKRWESYGSIPDDLVTTFEFSKMDKGGLSELREFFFSFPNFRMVVIDTLSDFWPEEQEGGKNAYYAEGDVFRQLKEMAVSLNIAIVLVHHHSKNGNKSGSGDFMKRGSGTQAVAGKMDSVISFDRPLDGCVATFDWGGKNIPGGKAVMMYHGATYSFSITSLTTYG